MGRKKGETHESASRVKCMDGVLAQKDAFVILPVLHGLCRAAEHRGQGILCHEDMQARAVREEFRQAPQEGAAAREAEARSVVLG